ncbi:MAG: DUF4190 domain-containing protein [Acidobacteriota bacterium]|nr:DUF4190 domain-containing protein [Acidobacteriota bacterium]
MTSVTCPKCNLTSFGTALSCRRCGYFWTTLAEKAAQTAPVTGERKSFGGEQSSDVKDENSQNFQAPDYELNNQTAWTQQPPPRNSQNFRQPNNQNYHQPNYYQPNYAQQQPALKSGLAIASMVIGIIGFATCLFGVILSPVGLVLGIVALVKANKNSSEYGGKSFAIAGTILNALGLMCLPIIAAIAVPNLLASRRAANEAAAISTVRKISAAEDSYRLSLGRGRCGDFQQLQAANLIDSTITGGQKNGYRFIITNLPLAGGGCEITATPLTASSGARSFYYSTEDGTIRTTNKSGQIAGHNDSPLGQETSSAPETNSSSPYIDGITSEPKTISTLRTLVSAEATYSATVGQGNCGTLQSLATAKLIDGNLAAGQKGGYKYEIYSLPAGQTGCEIYATPTASGNRSFYAASDGVIHGANKGGQLADKSDPPIN